MPCHVDPGEVGFLPNRSADTYQQSQVARQRVPPQRTSAGQRPSSSKPGGLPEGAGLRPWVLGNFSPRLMLTKTSASVARQGQAWAPCLCLTRAGTDRCTDDKNVCLAPAGRVIDASLGMPCNSVWSQAPHVPNALLDEEGMECIANGGCLQATRRAPCVSRKSLNHVYVIPPIQVDAGKFSFDELELLHNLVGPVSSMGLQTPTRTMSRA